MMHRFSRSARRHPLLALLFGLAVLAMLAFGVGFVRKSVYWAAPEHREQALEPWMTPRYIARSWDVDAAELARHLELDAPPGARPTLHEIARARGLSDAEILAEVARFLAAQERP